MGGSVNFSCYLFSFFSLLGYFVPVIIISSCFGKFLTTKQGFEGLPHRLPAASRFLTHYLGWTKGGFRTKSIIEKEKGNPARISGLLWSQKNRNSINTLHIAFLSFFPFPMGDSPYLHFKSNESSEDVVSDFHQRLPPYSPHGSDIQDDLSGEQSPTNGSVPNLADPSLPKKKTRSRTISSLTAEQLARKRAHDRDAQRAIRTRTKNQITSLESRVKELEREKGEWEFKTSELKKELENALDALDSIKRNGIQPPPVPGSTTSSGIVARPGLALSSKSPVSVRAESIGHPGYAESEHGSDGIALSSNGKDTPAGAMSLDFVCHGGFKPNGYRQIQDQPYEYTARKRSLADLTSSTSSDVQAEIRRRISGAQSLLTSSPVSTVYSIPSVQ